MRVLLYLFLCVYMCMHLLVLILDISGFPYSAYLMTRIYLGNLVMAEHIHLPR